MWVCEGFETMSAFVRGGVVELSMARKEFGSCKGLGAALAVVWFGDCGA